MAQEEICTRCRHARRAHSRKGCLEWLTPAATGKQCSCKVEFNNAGMFMMGTPKEEH